MVADITSVSIARSVLRQGPLRFGDPVQIEAVRLIELSESVMELIRALRDECVVSCPWCSGRGESACISTPCGRTCDECGGSGWLGCEHCFRGRLTLYSYTALPVERMSRSELIEVLQALQVVVA